MNERYDKNYRILGILPGTSWNDLRKAYKSLINTWHPDRFQQNARKKKNAEEKTKEITQSYKELAEYYKTFGILPLPIKIPEKQAGKPVASQTEQPAQTELAQETTGHADGAAEIPQAKTHNRWRSKVITRIISAAALLTTAYVGWQLVPWDHPDNSSTNQNQTHETEDTADNSDLDGHGNDSQKYFTIGSALGEVYSAQGIPTKTEDDVWYYGNSKVYFAKGRVVRWEENINNPLHVKLLGEASEIHDIFFSKGSQKKEVLAIQGRPSRDLGDVWEYGVSHVYFSRGRVSGWDESPLNPLRVPH